MPVRALFRGRQEAFSHLLSSLDRCYFYHRRELIDHAINAKATSIKVHISANCIDEIEVGNNCTRRLWRSWPSRTYKHDLIASKIARRSADTVWASVRRRLQVLGNVAVTTQRDGDVVASARKLNRGGGVASRSRCSHRVGKTVNINNLSDKIPVRREQWTKGEGIFQASHQDRGAGAASILCSLQSSSPPVTESSQKSKPSWTFAPRP